MAFKAIVDYSQEPDGDLSDVARAIYKGISANAALFPAPPLTMAAFLLLIQAYEGALSDSFKGGTDRTTAKNTARTALESAMGRLAGYVNTVADGDETILNQSGIPYYSTQHVAGGGPVTFVPTNVEMGTGSNPGFTLLTWTGDGTRATYEAQSCVGDPLVEANWTYRGSFSSGKALLGGFLPGGVAWGRVRKIGTNGQTGPWSDPAMSRAG